MDTVGFILNCVNYGSGMSMVFHGTGMAWEKLTHGLPVFNPIGDEVKMKSEGMWRASLAMVCYLDGMGVTATGHLEYWVTFWEAQTSAGFW